MFRTRNNYPTSPSQHIEYGTPKLTVIDGEGRTFTKSATSSASSKFYSENHPLSKTGRPIPYKNEWPWEMPPMPPQQHKAWLPPTTTLPIRI